MLSHVTSDSKCVFSPTPTNSPVVCGHPRSAPWPTPALTLSGWTVSDSRWRAQATRHHGFRCPLLNSDLLSLLRGSQDPPQVLYFARMAHRTQEPPPFFMFYVYLFNVKDITQKQPDRREAGAKYGEEAQPLCPHPALWVCRKLPASRHNGLNH